MQSELLLKTLNNFFVTLGVIFLIILLGLSYLWIVDPLNVKPFLAGMSPASMSKVGTNNNGAQGNEDKNPLLSADQEAQLMSMGVDPASLPTKITPEMTSCFSEKLGENRAKEIMEGASPSVSDYMKASPCFK